MLQNVSAAPARRVVTYEAPPTLLERTHERPPVASERAGEAEGQSPR
jgi:hypothetical protein